MKKENYLELNMPLLEEKLREKKLKLLNLRADMANRKLKNVKEITTVKKDIARVLFSMGANKKIEKVVPAVEETKE